MAEAARRLAKTIQVASEPCAIQVQERGKGPSILLLHGWLHSGNRWEGVMAGLESNYRLVAPDLPGFGRSPPLPAGQRSLDHYEQVVAGLVSAYAPLHAAVADSMGAVLLLRHLPKSGWPILRLALSGVPTDGIPKLQWMSRRESLTRRLLAAQRRMSGKVGASLVRTVASLSTVSKRSNVDAVLVDDARSADPETAATTLRELAHQTLNLTPPPLEAKVVVVRGALDQIVGAEAGHRLAAVLRGRYVEILDSGHTPMLEKPDEYLKAVCSVLGQGA